MSLRSKRGVGIVAVMMIVAALSIMGAAVATFVSTGAVSKTNDLAREQALALAQAGFEYAYMRLSDGVNPNGDVRTLGAGQFTVGYNNGSGLITVTPSVSGMFGSSTPTFTVQGPIGGNMANCLTVNSASANMQNGFTELRGITLQNTCATAITIANMTVSWNPLTAARVTAISINGNVRYSNAGGTASGVVIDITDHAIPAGATHPLTYITFNGNMGYKNYTINFGMSDGTSKQANVQFVSGNEAACLTVNTTLANIGTSPTFTDLLGITLQNTCAAPTVITITGMTNSWSPSAGRNMTAIDTGAAGNNWTGSVASGSTVNFTTTQALTGGAAAIPLNYIRYNGVMQGRNFTLIFRMSDGTTLTVPVNVYAANMGGCLTANNSGAYIGGIGRTVMGGQWINSCAGRLLVTTLTTSWTGVNLNRRLTNITIGASVWNGSVNTGVNVNIPDVEITTSVSPSFTWSNGINGICITHTVFFYDGTSKAIPQYCPP